MWAIIQLRNRTETPIIEKSEYAFTYPPIIIDDENDGRVYFGFNTKKEAEEQAKTWRWCERITNGNKYRYIVEREDRI